MSQRKALVNEVKRTLATNDILIQVTWTRKARHGTKIHEQWKGPQKRARVNNVVKWDSGWWHKHTTQASSHSLI